MGLLGAAYTTPQTATTASFATKNSPAAAGTAYNTVRSFGSVSAAPAALRPAAPAAQAAAAPQATPAAKSSLPPAVVQSLANQLLNPASSSGSSSSSSKTQNASTGSTMATMAPPPALTTSSNADPNTAEFLSMIKSRLAEQKAKESAPVTASADRAIDLARRDIADSSAGAKKRKAEELAARGLSSKVGVGAGQLRAIDEAAATRGARASADIGLSREKEQDALNLARANQVNNLYGAVGSASQVPFSQALQANQLGLQNWQALEGASQGREQLGIAKTAAANNNTAQQLAIWQALMNMAG